MLQVFPELWDFVIGGHPCPTDTFLVTIENHFLWQQKIWIEPHLSYIFLASTYSLVQFPCPIPLVLCPLKLLNSPFSISDISTSSWMCKLFRKTIDTFGILVLEMGCQNISFITNNFRGNGEQVMCLVGLKSNNVVYVFTNSLIIDTDLSDKKPIYSGNRLIKQAFLHHIDW